MSKQFMVNSNVSINKSLRQANIFLLGLFGLQLIGLIVAFLLTHYHWLAGFAGTTWLYNPFHTSLFLLTALLGSLLIYIDIYGKKFFYHWIILTISLILAGIISCIDIAKHWTVFEIASSVIIGLWSIGLCNLIWDCLFSNNKPWALNILLTYLLLPAFLLLANFALGLTITLHPKTVDPLLLAIDATLGFNPTFASGQLFFSLPLPITAFVNLIYFALPLGLAITYVARYQVTQNPPVELLIEFLTIGLIGMLLYHIICGCGPIYAFRPNWPWQTPTIPVNPTPISCVGPFLPRNSMPSLHTAWVVCLWRHSLPCHRNVKWLMTFWAIITLIATLGLGQHYLSDLVVGFALATCIGGISVINVAINNSARRNAILIGGIIVISWYFIILFGLPILRISPIIPWFLYVSSVGLLLMTEFKLTRAQHLIHS